MNNTQARKGETMRPTAADYEALTRALCEGRGDEFDELEDWERIDERDSAVEVTSDTMDTFRENARNWREPGRCVEVTNGLYWARCQTCKGDPRVEVCVADCGEFRLVYTV